MDEIVTQSARAYYGNEEPELEDREWDALPPREGEEEIGEPLPISLPSETKASDLGPFVKRTSSEYYIVSDKLDGNAAVLFGGRLFLKSGNKLGVDISWLLQIMRSGVGTGTVRGELVIRKGVPLGNYVNTRSAVNGLVHKRGNELAREIEFVSHELLESDASDVVTERYSELQKRGFTVVPHTRVSAEKVTDRAWLESFLLERKRDGPYPNDGLVVRPERFKVDPYSQVNRDSVAFKYGAPAAATTVRKVVYNTTRTGKIFPTVEIDPVVLDGRTISSVTGKSVKFIQENGVGPGSVVSISLSGDVIPNIERVIRKAPATAVPEPGDPWPGQLLYFVRGLKIKGIGPKKVQELTEQFKDLESLVFSSKVIDPERVRGTLSLAHALSIVSLKGIGPKTAERVVESRGVLPGGAPKRLIEWLVRNGPDLDWFKSSYVENV